MNIIDQGVSKFLEILILNRNVNHEKHDMIASYVHKLRSSVNQKIEKHPNTTYMH